MEREEFKIHYNTDITVDKVAVKISINQIVSFMSMIKNTSNILHEKYTEKIKKDCEMNPDKNSIHNSEPKKSIFKTEDILANETVMFKETFEVFSNRYYQVPKKRITEHFDVEDEEEEKNALTQKQQNLSKLKSKFRMMKDSVPEEEFKDIIEEEENIGKDTFSFYFHGLDIFFINDHRDNSYPVLCCSLKDTTYSRENLKGGGFQSQAVVDASFEYYNIKNGYWEPFVEGLDIEFQYDKQQNNSVVQIKGKDSINLNISPDFVSILAYCKESWNKANKFLQKSFGIIEEEKDMFSEELKQVFDDNEEVKTNERQSLFELIEDQNAVDIATPYKITNLTGNMIFVETLFENKKEKYILKDSQTVKIAISYDKQTNKNYDIESSKINDNVKILFEGLHLPIEKISLNKLGRKVHKLTDIDELYDFIFYETKVIDMNKVLTLRTQNLIINSTQF